MLGMTRLRPVALLDLTILARSPPTSGLGIPGSTDSLAPRPSWVRTPPVGEGLGTPTDGRLAGPERLMAASASSVEMDNFGSESFCLLLLSGCGLTSRLLTSRLASLLLLPSSSFPTSSVMDVLESDLMESATGHAAMSAVSDVLATVVGNLRPDVASIVSRSGHDLALVDRSLFTTDRRSSGDIDSRAEPDRQSEDDSDTGD